MAAYYAFAPVFAGSVLVGNAQVEAIDEATYGWINLANIATTIIAKNTTDTARMK